MEYLSVGHQVYVLRGKVVEDNTTCMVSRCI